MNNKEKHLENYMKLQLVDRTSSSDFERKALFYILATDGIYEYVEKIYDFDFRFINFEDIENLNLSRGHYNMLQLAFNLYNGYETDDLHTLFLNLDHSNLSICLEAIKIRFSISI